MLPASSKIRLAVVTGGHSFDVPSFYAVFHAMNDVDFYPQALDEFAADAETAAQYDAVMFYNHHQNKPGSELPWFQKNFFSTLDQLGRKEQGIAVLHHSFHAFFDYPLWDELTGHYRRREVKVPAFQDIAVQIADADHPITRGLQPYSLFDEPYQMPPALESDGNHLLLTTDNPQSMSSIAWTREFRDSRVFCFQSGHDHKVFQDENYRRVMHNAVHWLAGRV